MSWCKVCWSAYAKQYNAQSAAKHKRATYKASPTGKAKERMYRAVRDYGPEGATMEQRRSAEGASCDVCGGSKLLRIDHEHRTSRVRGILCHGCNVTLGLVADDAARLRALAAYVEKHRGGKPLKRLARAR